MYDNKMNMYDMGCCVGKWMYDMHRHVGKWMSDMSHHHSKCITSCVAMPGNVCLTCVALSENVCSTRVAISKNVCSTCVAISEIKSMFDTSSMSAINFRQIRHVGNEFPTDDLHIRLIQSSPRTYDGLHFSVSRHVPMSELKVVSADILCRKL